MLKCLPPNEHGLIYVIGLPRTSRGPEQATAAQVARQTSGRRVLTVKITKLKAREA